MRLLMRSNLHPQFFAHLWASWRLGIARAAVREEIPWTAVSTAAVVRLAVSNRQIAVSGLIARPRQGRLAAGESLIGH